MTHLEATAARIREFLKQAQDVDGESRPAGTGYDLGADEFWYRVYLPLVLRNQ